MPAEEALDLLAEQGHYFNSMRLKSFPFQQAVADFIDEHETVYVIEQNGSPR